MSDFSRVMELAMAANLKQANEAMGVFEPPPPPKDAPAKESPPPAPKK